MAERILTTISSITRNKDPFELPGKYKFLRVLGQGGFGLVLKCLKKDTKDIVAVKLPKHDHNDSDIREFSMLQNLMHHNLDKCNIVKFYDWFEVRNGKALVFESLDISLDEYIHYNHPLCLSKIRLITQQLATAFDALKTIRVIHTDVKPDNIMVVNRWTNPIRVKLIDFGLAIPATQTRTGMRLQTVFFRAPEIILGLPFSEAIDMWSLGGVLAAMILGYILFPGKDEYEALRFMTQLLGQPADDLLRKGRKTDFFFNKTDTNGWRLMTPEEYWGKDSQSYVDRRMYKYASLDYLKQIRREDKLDEAVEREKCIELLKGMLKIDEAERITPSEVLTHPFIAQGCNNSCNEAPEAAAAQPSQTQTQTQTQTESEVPTERTTADESTRGALSLTSTQRPLSQESAISEVLSSASEHPVCVPPAPSLMDEATSIHPDHHSRSPKISRTVVIMVRPATAENTVTLESEESDTSSQSWMSESSLEVSDSDSEMSWTSEDSTSSDDSGTTEEEDKKMKKKKKKNCFRRFFSWMKKNFCCCCTGVQEDD
ncbi:homeodomain-interacting protein kinase 1-like isoform X2 [Thunnus albacares]|uniref:homeodomain-interacting protein kinase 1-like isoform X2 n=1 Tax=Thunnus albacares TaxID=8236 RepID=UPI001CF6F916|nr:homeodomain-interacting protein kinase 1-like isoform X2 [Thunnus albacares]